jgi:predicted O-methyltransferase YrrM
LITRTKSPSSNTKHLPTAFQIKTFISYWLNAVDEHSLHSPFFFDFYKNVVQQKSREPLNRFEGLRKKLKQDNRTISVNDFGSGSQHHSGIKRKISNIANTSLSSPKFASLYQRVIKNYDSRNIIELGTSLGINTLYIANHDGANVTTFEGASAIADLARITFEFAQAKNIKLIEGHIDTTLPTYLQTTGKIDFVFMDANHRYDPTLKYFDWLIRKVHHKSIIAVDDIHYSPEMERAWQAMKSHTMVYGSADLYRSGLLFFDPSLNKQHVVLQF